jgi:hypothetical protein
MPDRSRNIFRVERARDAEIGADRSKNIFQVECV